MSLRVCEHACPCKDVWYLRLISLGAAGRRFRLALFLSDSARSEASTVASAPSGSAVLIGHTNDLPCHHIVHVHTCMCAGTLGARK